MRTRTVALGAALSAAVAIGAPAPLAHSDTTRANVHANQHYSAHGVVKSFGPKRAYVMIAHEKIPGYMDAMTMPFEPRTDDQLAGIEVGAHVVFTFTVTDDARMLLDRIAKE